jgi:GTP-binding protein EngB required for normal cell division
MKTVENYLKAIQESLELAKPCLDSVKQEKYTQEEVKLEEYLKKDSFIKVPFVGDFNSGKSSLINAYLERDLLTTNMLPETAFAYELYYSEKEYYEIFHNDKVIETSPIEKLSSVKAAPGDVVRIYINDNKIKQLNERGIVIVDMPGIDSGIEAHNNAILHYIEEGTCFIVFVDAEQATIRNSTISFINEIKKYNLSAFLLISKADKKPAEELVKIQDFITTQAKRYLGEDAVVGVTSSADKNYNDLIKVLDLIDVDALIAKKHKSSVGAYINELIDEIQIKIHLTATDKKDFDAIIKQLQDKQKETLANLKKKQDTAQSVSSSTDNILDDVRGAIVSKETTLANMLMESNGDYTNFNGEMMSIIRPVLVNSFKREVSEYQDSLSVVINDFSTDINNILQENDNKLLKGAEVLLGGLLGAEGLDVLLKKGMDALIKKFAEYKGIAALLKVLGKAAGPVIVIVANLIPDLIRLIFGKSKEKKIDSIKSVIRNQMLNKITETLRPEIEQMIQQQQEEVFSNLNKIVVEEIAKIEDNIKEIREQKQINEEEIKKQIEVYSLALSKINSIQTQLA